MSLVVVLFSFCWFSFFVNCVNYLIELDLLIGALDLMNEV